MTRGELQARLEADPNLKTAVVLLTRIAVMQKLGLWHALSVIETLLGQNGSRWGDTLGTRVGDCCISLDSIEMMSDNKAMGILLDACEED